MTYSAYNNNGTIFPADASSLLIDAVPGAAIPIRMLNETDKHAFFESAVTRLMERLYGAAMRFTRNASDAEDLMSEALEKAWNNLDSLQDREKFDGWMMRILSNTYISQWRRQKVRDTIFDDESCPHDLDDKNSLYAKLHQPFLLWWGTPEQTFVNNLLIEDIARALDEISEAYRDVVVMVEVLGFSYEEVANDLEVPVGTVRSRLNRGRRMLQDALWQNARDAGLNVKEASQEVK
ncbi:MAG: sigma-70 family RNA polymerase sigma factor [Pseudomonadota bacterium]